MTMEEFNPIYLVLDEERSDVLNYIARTAYATKHGQILNDVGRDRLFKAISDLDIIEHAYEQLKNVESLIEGILPASERCGKVSDIING